FATARLLSSLGPWRAQLDSLASLTARHIAIWCVSLTLSVHFLVPFFVAMLVPKATARAALLCPIARHTACSKWSNRDDCAIPWHKAARGKVFGSMQTANCQLRGNHCQHY